MSRALTLLLGCMLLLVFALPAAAEADLAQGKDAFTATCGKCHALDRSLKAEKDAEGWRATVARMSGNFKGRFGNPITDANQAAIVAYLAAKDTLGATCSRCHGLGQVLGAKKDLSGWEATVKRMSGYAQDSFDKAIPAEDQKTIIQYLLLNAGK